MNEEVVVEAIVTSEANEEEDVVRVVVDVIGLGILIVDVEDSDGDSRITLGSFTSWMPTT